MRFAPLLFLALAINAGAAVTLPGEVKAKPGRLVKVEAKGDDGKIVRWVNVHDGLDLIESESGRWAILTAPAPGRYKIAAYSDAGGAPAYCVVVVEGEAPKPIDPPPGPNPPPGPTPVGPLRVLMVYESADLAKMPAAQQAVIYGRKVRDYLNAKCEKEADGKTRGWRIWDKDADASAEASHWQTAMKRPRASVPFIHILKGDSIAYEGPLPASADEALALLKKYGGE